MRKRRSGFVLLMTVALIALAATAMARLASRSLAVVARGTLAQQQLQRRWAQTSCQKFVLERANEIFGLAEEDLYSRGVGWPYADEIELAVELDGQHYQLVLRDEQARANINRLEQHGSHVLVSALSRAAVSTAAPIDLRPAPQASDQLPVAKFTSWGQVVNLTRVGRDRSLVELLEPLTNTFTCWGNGRINLARASDEAIRLTAADVLDGQEIEQFIRARRGYSGDIEGLLTSLEFHRRKQLRLKQLISQDSNCYSLLVSIRSTDRLIETYSVDEQSGATGASPRVFQW